MDYMDGQGGGICGGIYSIIARKGSTELPRYLCGEASLPQPCHRNLIGVHSVRGPRARNTHGLVRGCLSCKLSGIPRASNSVTVRTEVGFRKLI